MRDRDDITQARFDATSAAAGVFSAESRFHAAIAIFAILAIAAYLVLRYAFHIAALWSNVPLYAALALGGAPLIFELLRQVFRGNFGADLLAGISIITAALLGEYLAGGLVVLMLSGGETLEAYAVRQASSALRALAARMPSMAHVRRDGKLIDIPATDIDVGDVVVVMPHEICPVDGLVAEGHGSMDESYLTGEPYHINKAPGSEVLSGAVNSETPLTITATRKPQDSRYARIMQVMRESEQHRPKLRRLGDTLGALYTPVAVLIAIVAGIVAHDPIRFLAVLVVATPCPLLIGIPVAIIGSISLAAKRGIIIKDPAVLEQLSTCETIFFDKTGTLTYGEPRLTKILTAPGFTEPEVLAIAASIEEYSKHPLAEAVKATARARSIQLLPVEEAVEPPGKGLTGRVGGRKVTVTGRKHLSPEILTQLPPIEPGLEFILLIDDRYAATFHFRDEPRADVESFISHLGPHHDLHNLVLLTGDRAAEAHRLAESVGIETVYADKSPEQKLEIVRAETALRRTAYLGDGINDAPSLVEATVGIAFGRASDVTAEAASAVILDSSLRKLDEFFHIAQRLRRIALQSAVGGMALSLIAIGFAAAGYLPPVAGALLQEAIDVVVVLNALRAAVPPKMMSDM